MNVISKEFHFESEEELEEFLKGEFKEKIAEIFKNEKDEDVEIIEEKGKRAFDRLNNAIKKIQALNSSRGYTCNQSLKIVKAYNKCAEIFEKTYAEVK